MQVRGGPDQNEVAKELCQLLLSLASHFSPGGQGLLSLFPCLAITGNPCYFQVHFLACGIVLSPCLWAGGSILGELSSHGFADPAVYTIWVDTRNKTGQPEEKTL